jgi:Ca-activated chloride channel homolog
VPSPKDNVSGELFDVSTVFLSKRKGAIVLRLDGTNLGQLTENSTLDLGTVDLSFATTAGAAVTDSLKVSLPIATAPAADAPLYPSPEIARTLAVTDEYLAMRRVCEEYHEGTIDLDDAKARLDAAIAKLTSADAALADDNLKREIAMLDKLKQNLSH